MNWRYLNKFREATESDSGVYNNPTARNPNSVTETATTRLFLSSSHDTRYCPEIIQQTKIPKLKIDVKLVEMGIEKPVAIESSTPT